MIDFENSSKTYLKSIILLNEKGNNEKIMSNKTEKIKLSKWLDKNIPAYFPNKGMLIEIIENIAEATIPIRGLLERGITSREISHRMNLEKPMDKSINLYDEEQIHEDVLTHGIIIQALKERDVKYAFVASEESEPILGDGTFGITIDPVDGSSNVAVNRTVGTIVGIYNQQGNIICAFYALYGIFTNLVIAINGIVAEFILDTSPYSMTFYHYVFQEIKKMPNPIKGGIRCLGGDPKMWSLKCKNYESKLIAQKLKDRYSGSFVGDFHAILKFGGLYGYFPSPKPKIRLYYEWYPLAFIIRTLGGNFIAIGDENNVDSTILMEEIKPLTKQNVKEIHTIVCGGILGSEKVIDLFLNL